MKHKKDQHTENVNICWNYVSNNCEFGDKGCLCIQMGLKSNWIALYVETYLELKPNTDRKNIAILLRLAEIYSLAHSNMDIQNVG